MYSKIYIYIYMQWIKKYLFLINEKEKSTNKIDKRKFGKSFFEMYLHMCVYLKKYSIGVIKEILCSNKFQPCY